jgi:hypothetical protein
MGIEFNKGFASQTVNLEDQIEKAAKVYEKYLWGNRIQGYTATSAMPMPKVVEFANGERVDFQRWLGQQGAKTVCVPLGIVAGWLLMQNKGDNGWSPFWHQFKPQNAPILAMDPNDHQQFFLCGGRYRMEERGIID